MKTNNNKVNNNNLLQYIEQLQHDPVEREKLNRTLQRKQKKLSKNKETEFAAMFLSAIRF